MRTLTARDIRRLRLRNHWLAPRPEANATQVVEHLGALQSQEIWSGLWSIGARSSQLDLAAVQLACEQATILRTWPMRNTVHFIPSADARWMLSIAESFAFKGVERRRAHIGLTEATAEAAYEILANALDHGEPTPRDRCLAILEEAGVLTERRHGYHLLWFAAQRGVICMGPQQGSTQTFVKLDNWVDAFNDLAGDDALGELASRYFTSHGPAGVPELKRWTGLGMRQVRRAIELAGDRIGEVPTEFGPMLMGAVDGAAIGDKPVEPPDERRRVLLLSGFDEYVLGYGDRSAIMEPDQLQAVVPGNNGMFRPTIVDDGTVIGVWKRKVTTARVDIFPEPFTKFSKRQQRAIERAAGHYAAFLGLEPRVRWAGT